MAAESGGAAHLDRGHDAPLRGRERSTMLLTIGFAVAAEDVRHFELRAIHRARRSEVLGWCGLGLSGTGRGSKSSGLEVEHTLLVAMRR